MPDDNTVSYSPVCEICSSSDGVKRCGPPDRGGVILCRSCRVLFGYEGAQNDSN